MRTVIDDRIPTAGTKVGVETTVKVSFSICVHTPLEPPGLQHMIHNPSAADLCSITTELPTPTLYSTVVSGPGKRFPLVLLQFVPCVHATCDGTMICDMFNC